MTNETHRKKKRLKRNRNTIIRKDNKQKKIFSFLLFLVFVYWIIGKPFQNNFFVHICCCRVVIAHWNRLIFRYTLRYDKHKIQSNGKRRVLHTFLFFVFRLRSNDSRRVLCFCFQTIYFRHSFFGSFFRSANTR